MNIYIELNLTPPEKQQLTQILAGDTAWFARPGATTPEDEQAFLASDIVFGNVSREWIPRASKLRWMQFPSAGFDSYLPLDWAKLSQRITVTNLRGLFAQPVVETCLGGILSLYRGLNDLQVLQSERCWQKMEVRARIRSLSGARVLIAGAGSIARRMRDVLAPFHCDVRLYGRTGLSAEITSLAAMDDLLPAMDIVCSFLPDTEATRRIFDASRFSLFQDGALFVNAGRGSAVDEKALVEALHAGKIGGAVLDVTQQEPLPREHPFWNCPRLLLTQHTAAGSSDENRRLIEVFEKNYRRYKAGEALENQVDWKRGY